MSLFIVQLNYGKLYGISGSAGMVLVYLFLWFSFVSFFLSLSTNMFWHPGKINYFLIFNSLEVYLMVLMLYT